MASPGQFVPEYIVTANDMNALPGGVLGYAKIETESNGFASETTIGPAVNGVAHTAGRLVKVTLHIPLDGSSVGNVARIRLKADGTTVQSGELAVTNVAGDDRVLVLVHVGEHSGTVDWTITIQMSSGSGTVRRHAQPGKPAHLIVEDIGPA